MALSADRSYMFLDDDGENCIQLSKANAGIHSMANGYSRLHARFPAEPEAIEEAFEEDANGDLMPVQGIHINDNTWGLNENNELYLKANYFKPNFGPPMNIIGGDAYFDFENLFTEDVTF